MANPEPTPLYRSAQVSYGKQANGEPYFEVRLKVDPNSMSTHSFQLTTAGAHALRSALHDSLIMQVRSWAQGQMARNLNLNTPRRGRF